MKIKALAPWMGSKRNMAATVVAELGEHAVYWEPFAGSMAILLAKPPCSMETVNDLHGDLTNLARVIQHPELGATLYRRLRRIWLAEELFLESAEVIRTEKEFTGDLDVDRAFHYFIASWFGRNGLAGTRSYNAGFCARYTSNGGHAARRVVSAVDSIPAWRRRLRGVTILRRDAVAVCGRIEDKSGTAIYVDPPYVSKGADYLHDFEADHHVTLRDALARFRKTRVVLSYYDHPTIRELYAGWTFRAVKASRSLGNQGGTRGAKSAPEVLIINGPSAVVSPDGVGQLF